MALLTSFFGLNSEVEKFQFVEERNVYKDSLTTEVENPVNIFRFTDIGFTDKLQVIIKRLEEWFAYSTNGSKISANVLALAYTFLETLYPSMIEQLDLEDIYTTDYGTIIFDWEKDKDNIFSLEIGATQIGYFIEINGVDKKQVDAIDFMVSKEVILKDLNDFLNV